MRSVIHLSIGLCLIVAAAAIAGDENPIQPSKESYVKVRVEVEMRGLLRATDKGITVTARDQMYNLFNDAEEITDASRATAYTLDFARAKDLRELAKDLSSKEVVVTGISELRMVTRMSPPGGITGAGGSSQVPPYAVNPFVDDRAMICRASWRWN
jgi:hypothetical protein